MVTQKRIGVGLVNQDELKSWAKPILGNWWKQQGFPLIELKIGYLESNLGQGRDELDFDLSKME